LFSRRARFGARAVLPGLLGCILWTDSPAQSGALFAVPTESHAAQPLAADTPWQIALQARDLPALAHVLHVGVPAAGAETLDYTLDGYPEISANPARTWLESTFVIDYQEPDVVKVYQAFLQLAGQQWTPPQLVDFVSARMTASMAHGFEIASQVARAPSGDCKEYAVLTAALARSAGVPARVALGLALLEHDGQYGAFGHAWAELREGNRWVVADAAIHNFSGVVRYLPFGIVEDEGPGFQMAFTRLTPVWIQRVVILGERKN
jgi:hypothetical protein